MQDVMRVDDGRVLKKIRKLLGITRAELAETAGISQSHLDKIEAGFRIPSVKTWQKLLDALNANIILYVPDTSVQDQYAMRAYDILYNSTDTQAKFLIAVLECMADNI